MRKIHSNSYVDLDNDRNADIIVTTEQHFEIWHNTGKNGEDANDDSNFLHTKSVKLPKECGNQGSSCKVGQLAFADFDLDGQLDLIFPVCHDGKDCANSTIYFCSTNDLWHKVSCTQQNKYDLEILSVRNFVESLVYI